MWMITILNPPMPLTNKGGELLCIPSAIATTLHCRDGILAQTSVTSCRAWGEACRSSYVRLHGRNFSFKFRVSAVLEGVLPHNEMHFAAKWVAFCRKMECILPQNGLHFAAKWVAFCRKMGCVLAQNGLHFGPKWSAFWPKMENDYPINSLYLCDFTAMKVISYYQARVKNGEI